MCGRKNRAAIAFRGNVDGMVDQLRDNNQRKRGAQPIVPPKARRRKATGSRGGAPPMVDPRAPTPDWEAAKRDLDWATPLNSASRTYRPTGVKLGEGGRCLEEASHISDAAQPRENAKSLPKTSHAEKKRQLGDPAAPERPHDLRNCDSAKAE